MALFYIHVHCLARTYFPVHTNANNIIALFLVYTITSSCYVYAWTDGLIG